MKRTIKMMIFLFILTSAMAQIVSGEVPAIISYQGILADTNGMPLNGNYSISARIYNAATDGTALWEETHSGVPVVDGVFNIMLGKVTPFPSNLNFSVPYWLGISINGEAEFTPRLEFASVGTALMAKTVSDGAITTAKIANGAITGTKIANGQVVKGLNGLKDNVTLTPGSNVTITYPGNNQIQIGATSTKISCNWSGWYNSIQSIDCPWYYCNSYAPTLRFYCSGGVITQASTVSVCATCNDGGN